MNREEYISLLRSDLLSMVEEYLTPVAMRYGYSEAPLEANIKWRPLVLVLGNYSSRFITAPKAHYKSTPHALRSIYGKSAYKVGSKYQSEL